MGALRIRALLCRVLTWVGVHMRFWAPRACLGPSSDRVPPKPSDLYPYGLMEPPAIHLSVPKQASDDP